MRAFFAWLNGAWLLLLIFGIIFYNLGKEAMVARCHIGDTTKAVPIARAWQEAFIGEAPCPK